MNCEIARDEANLLDNPDFLTSEQTLDKCSGLLLDQLKELNLFSEAEASPIPFEASPQPTAEPAATPSPTATVEPAPTATPTPLPTARPTAIPTPTPSPTSPRGYAHMTDALPGGSALAYYAPTQMLIVAHYAGGISEYRLNSTRVDASWYLYPPIIHYAISDYVFNDLKFSGDGEYLYGATRNGFVVLKFFPNGTVSGPLGTILADDEFGCFEIQLYENFAFVSCMNSIKKIDLSNPDDLSVVAEIPWSGSIRGIAVKDGYLITSHESDSWSPIRLRIFSPELEQVTAYTSQNLSSILGKMEVDGDLIYSASGSVVTVLNASNLSNLRVQATIPFQGNPEYLLKLKALVVTPTRVYASGSWYQQYMFRTYGVIAYFEKAGPLSMQSYWNGKADGDDLIVDENNPYFFGGVAAVQGSSRGSVLHLGLLPTQEQFR
jgi:hypothetical protein